MAGAAEGSAGSCPASEDSKVGCHVGAHPVSEEEKAPEGQRPTETRTQSPTPTRASQLCERWRLSHS